MKKAKIKIIEKYAYLLVYNKEVTLILTVVIMKEQKMSLST